MPTFRMSIQDENGFYYSANLTSNGWALNPMSIPSTYLQHLPKEWDKMELSWERDTNYMGVFRSMSNAFQFSNDGRAILDNIWITGSIQAYALLVIEMLIETESSPGASDQWRYEIIYQSEFDFKTAKNDAQTELFQIKTLDSRLYELLKAWGNTQFNIPFWKYDAVHSFWDLQSNAINHTGIKLLYSASYATSASTTNPLDYTVNQLLGYHHGNVGDSAHTIPAMNQYNIVQNNGTTTFIGNDILQPFLIQGNQSPGSLHVVNEIDFRGANNSNPYSTNNFIIKNLLPPNASIDLCARVQGQFDGTIAVGGSSPDPFIGFVLFEIGGTPPNDNIPPITGGQMQYINVYKYMLPPSPFAGYAPPSSGVFDSGLVPITLKYDKVYVFCIIHDGITGAGIGLAASASCKFSSLNFTLQSNYNSGSGSPVAAPSFPGSAVLAFSPYQILQNLVPCLNSVESDPYGFPLIPGGTPYAGVSTFLTDAFASPNYDNVPYFTFMTSGNALRLINGQPYISMSLSGLFSMCFKLWCCGLGIENDNVVIEGMDYFFDASTLIADLGNNVFGLTREPLTQRLGCMVKAGYNAPSTNNDYGVESVHRNAEYTTPVTKIAATIDMQENGVIADQYATEKARAQHTTQPIENPSASNETYLIEVVQTVGTIDVVDPGGSTHTVTTAYTQLAYPTAQNTDPTAATSPYVAGMYYPDTAMNLGITPAKNLYRNGKFLHSLLDGLDSEKIVFRKQYQMQYNNTSLELPGIFTNLGLGAGLIKETADIQISDLDAKLFRPYLLNFTASSPINMYALMSSNPRGYIQFTWVNKYGVETVYKGFIWSAKQRPGNNAAVDFKLLCHPTTTDADLMAI
jgi:hypothetical protein